MNLVSPWQLAKPSATAEALTTYNAQHNPLVAT